MEAITQESSFSPLIKNTDPSNNLNKNEDIDSGRSFKIISILFSSFLSCFYFIQLLGPSIINGGDHFSSQIMSGMWIDSLLSIILLSGIIVIILLIIFFLTSYKKFFLVPSLIVTFFMLWFLILPFSEEFVKNKGFYLVPETVGALFPSMYITFIIFIFSLSFVSKKITDSWLTILTISFIIFAFGILNLKDKLGLIYKANLSFYCGGGYYSPILNEEGLVIKTTKINDQEYNIYFSTYIIDRRLYDVKEYNDIHEKGEIAKEKIEPKCLDVNLIDSYPSEDKQKLKSILNLK